MKSRRSIFEKYTDLLVHYETMSKNALRNGKKLEAVGWRIAWIAVASPVWLPIMLWLSSLE